MAHVVFLRAANVGGHNVFRPAQFVAALKHLDVVNVGAAGTFVVRKKASATAIRREIESRLPFETHVAVRSAAEILALVESRPFDGVEFSKDRRGWVGALCARPSLEPHLPVSAERGGGLVVRFDRVVGSFALGIWQRVPGGFVIPANVVEKALGAPTTVRWWETYLKIAKLLE